MQLGCIGDDFTGSSDLANTLAKGGMRTVQYSGIPEMPAPADVDAGVIALKSRSIDPDEAVQKALEALKWLQAQGCQQFFFKYCSTFDSTDQGNIGPVVDALAEALDALKVIVCPAFPGAGRSVYQGHLFVADKLLNESGMESHPLTPMNDPDIRRCLSRQTRHSVGHVPAADVFAGHKSISQSLAFQQDQGHRHIVVDALRDDDLLEIGKSAKGLPLITGGSGIALGLPANFGHTATKVPWVEQTGKTVILSGSCSNATRAQVDYHAARHPSRALDVTGILEGRLQPREIAHWLLHSDGLPLVYTSADPDDVAKTQAAFGRAQTSQALEQFFAETAALTVQGGATRVITAGGETSGAIIEGLDLSALDIGPEIAAGVPAMRARKHLVVALKSGNFGTEDFFEKAHELLTGTP
jgi:uncharacterized protein YgbK (DUF1537 family)